MEEKNCQTTEWKSQMREWRGKKIVRWENEIVMVEIVRWEDEKKEKIVRREIEKVRWENEVDKKNRLVREWNCQMREWKYKNWDAHQLLRISTCCAAKSNVDACAASNNSEKSACYSIDVVTWQASRLLRFFFPPKKRVPHFMCDSIGATECATQLAPLNWKVSHSIDQKSALLNLCATQLAPLNWKVSYSIEKWANQLTKKSTLLNLRAARLAPLNWKVSHSIDQKKRAAQLIRHAAQHAAQLTVWHDRRANCWDFFQNK